MGPRRWAPLLCAALVVLAGCSTGAQRACTAMGGYDGVHFEVPASVWPPSAPLPLRARYCAGEACQEAAVETHGDAWFFAYNDQLSEVVVTARLSVVDAAGAPVLEASTSVAPELVDINGGGCGPMVWQARAVAAADGTLSAVPVD
ncbi:hypothetical protein [Kineococcus sp. SYSU DK005]|uniref:hypothetical protein n=1 Tax=Kineococcus sp. SYSU DK005 TaxID=3383126 RepID=UPI003D7EF946